MNILYLHDLHSIPGGIKPTYLSNHGHTVHNPHLPDDDFEESVRIAQAEFDEHQPDVVVGSSRGGAIAMNIDCSYDCSDAQLVLLCPAWKKYGLAKTVKSGTTILHSQADNVVPFADSEELVRNSNLSASCLVETGSDHRLADPGSLKLMLKACLGVERVGETFQYVFIFLPLLVGGCWSVIFGLMKAFTWLRRIAPRDIPELNGFLIFLPALFLWIPISFVLGNAIMYIVPPLRRRAEDYATAVGQSGFQKSQIQLLKIAAIMAIVSVPLIVLGFVL